MSPYIVTAETSLRPDPDIESSGAITLTPDDYVTLVRVLADWSKITFVDKAGQNHLGWVPSTSIREAEGAPIALFDQPLSDKSREVFGEIVETLGELAGKPWKMVRVRTFDGSMVIGWINAGTTPPVTPAPAAQPDEPEGDNLVLGVNEPYRPHLLRAQQITQIDAAALAAVIDAEAARIASGPNKGMWDARSRAETSTAAGLTQFLANTWLDHARKSGTLLNTVCRDKGYVTEKGKIVAAAREDILDLRFDPELSIISAAEACAANFAALEDKKLIPEQLGDDDRVRYMYLAHHEGLRGAEDFLAERNTHSIDDLAAQAGKKRAVQLVAEAGGDAARAYRNWLNAYIDEKIQPERFRRKGADTSQPSVAVATTVTLANFKGPDTPVATIGQKPQLAKAIQGRLTELGYLDPPADGRFGPVSNWALIEFCRLNDLSLAKGFTAKIAATLLRPKFQLPEIRPGGTWFDRVVAYMIAKGYFINRHPECKNIVYLEGVDKTGALNDDAPNVFNDLRIVFSIDKDGVPQTGDAIWEATTEPGAKWTIAPMNPRGAARIALNQFKAWAVGTHHPFSDSAHEALVQVEAIDVYRDLNKDFKRTGDRLETGLFAINQHWGYDAPRDKIGNTSAGCLVGRLKSEHKDFMKLIKTDPRYNATHSYRFMTAILPGDEALKEPLIA